MPREFVSEKALDRIVKVPGQIPIQLSELMFHGALHDENPLF